MANSTDPSKLLPRQRLALVTLTKELFHQLNEVSTLKKQKRDWEHSMGVLRDMALVLEFIPEHLRNAYLEMLPVISTGTSSPRPLSFDENFARVALPFKKRFISRIAAELIEDPESPGL